MELNKIATVAGKGQLFRIIGSTKSGPILESLDDQKIKMVATAQHRLSVLSEISIYTTTKEGTAPLHEVLKKVHAQYQGSPGVDANADGELLKSFLKTVLPDYDAARVYVSDIRKMVRWYGQLLRHAPALLQSDSPAVTATPPEAG
jgi:hypothetical protein